jgi:hypothetical protein
VKWFEVDRADVLAAKRTAVTAAGASFVPCTGEMCVHQADMLIKLFDSDDLPRYFQYH